MDFSYPSIALGHFWMNIGRKRGGGVETYIYNMQRQRHRQTDRGR